MTFAASPAPGGLPKPTIENVAYGPHQKQVLDFYQAESEQPAPVLFFIHGGGWMNGDKQGEIPELQNCLRGGISVVSINYRLIPDAQAKGIEPPVDACFQDAARALQFVRTRAAEWRIDPLRIGVSGGSAGGYLALWLAFHPDLAEPRSADPVRRQSTRVTCALTYVPQTSLDPLQMRTWIPNIDYGHHAFSLPSFQDFVNQRERLLPWIRENSPYELVSVDDPPVYLFYDSAVAMGQPGKDAVHAANFGAGLAEKLQETGVPFEFNYIGGPQVAHPNIFGFVQAHLRGVAPKKIPAASGETPVLFNFETDLPNVQAEESTVSEGEHQGQKVIEAEFQAGAPYPHLQFPLDGEVDLSAFQGVEAEIANLGLAETKVALRVENPGDWQKEPWNTEIDSIAPGESKTISVTFGKSFGAPGFALEPSRISSLQIFVPSPAQAVTLQIRRLAPFGGKGQ